MLTPQVSAERWRRFYPRLKAFHAKHGHVDCGGMNEPLRRWLVGQLSEARAPDYPPKRRLLLESLGFKFHPPINEATWHARMAQLRDYVAANGTWRVGDEEPALKEWLSVARRLAREGVVSPHHVRDLAALGVSIAKLPKGGRNTPAEVVEIAGPVGEEFGADWEQSEVERPRN
jgi:hypothetical protein